jgi:hypothetical protein
VTRQRLRGLLLALVGSLALAAPTGAAAATAAGTTPEVEALVEAIGTQRAAARHWQRVMGRRLRPAGRARLETADLARLQLLLEQWRGRAKRLRATAARPPHRAQWRCIHRHEGAWDDPRAPYYGGLQMDIGFQRAYGRYLLRRKGTADRWSPTEQMWTAERALRAGRGFHPWPVAARRCGLI